MSGEPEKYVPVPVNPKPCADEERDAHLEAFIRAFVERPRRARMRHILFESPRKAVGELHKIYEWLRKDRVTELTGSAPFPSALSRRFGKQRGVYVDSSMKCGRIQAPEAATWATQDYADAIYSLEPGRLAIVFHHDCGTWLCQAPRNP